MQLVDLYNDETRIKAEKTLMDAFVDFLPMAMQYLKIDMLPSIKLEKNIAADEHPTFGRFVDEENKVYIAINDRQPTDILRTLAHELVHYKQGTEHNLGPDSGETGSPIENEAHAVAGVIMRQFNEKYPDYLKARPIIEDISLKFKTIVLSENQIYNYFKIRHKLYQFESLPQRIVSGIKRFSHPKIHESVEHNEIQPIIDLLQRVDLPKSTKIKVGDYFSVLEFEINFAWKEIDAFGFLKPKEITEINLTPSGQINYIGFLDGDRYPRLTPATFNNRPVTYASYFRNKKLADRALIMISLSIPTGWNYNSSSVEI